jgi:head-tail adaptor
MGLTVDTRIAKKFKHRLSVCRQEDVMEGKELVYRKQEIYTGWAMIDRRRAGTFSQQDQAVFAEKDQRTHFIRMRYRPDVLISTAAWLYEARLKSAPRWFKILFAGDEYEDSRYFYFECKLIEHGDEVIQPVRSPNELVPVIYPTDVDI